MASLFYLLTLYASARGRHALAVVACALGMACKETMVTAPVMVVLYDRVFAYPSLRDAFRARWRLYVGLAATWLLLAALISSGPRWESAGFATGISPWTYLLNQSVVIVEYLKRVVWPVRLVLDYGEPRAFTLADVAWQAALVVTLLVLTGVALLKRPAAGFAAAAFFLILAPTTSIVPIATEVGAERRMYLPLAALIAFVVVAARAALLHATRSPGRELRRGTAQEMRRGPSWSAGALALVVIPLAVLTIQRNSDYADERRLWETTLERWPTARAHRNYATVLKRAGYRDEVIDHLRLSLDGHPEGRYALGYELFEQGRFAEAIEELRRFAVDVPNDRFVTTARGLVAESLQRLGRLDEAIQEYEGVTAAWPQSEPAWRGLGLALAQAGRHREAIAALERAIALDAANGGTRRAIASLLLQEDKPSDALPHAEAAVRLAPSDPAARFVTGVALIGVGRIPEAERELRTAIELDPSNPDARDLLSRVEALR
jgi:tetratricopeptide (TPR) repeat protein